MRILYVEDDATQAQTVEAMLEGEDHFCHTTDSGEQAVLLAKRNEYDMIILDIMLPDIDGYEVIQRMQAAGITTPCLIQSGFVDFDELLERLGPGVDDCLLKPFNKIELLEHMESVRSQPKRSSLSALAKKPDSRKQPPSSESERRKGGRVATLKSAEIINGDDRFACVILNLSAAGAAIRLPAEKQPCPSTFKLRIQPDILHQCQLCWSAGDNVGVKFVEAEDTENESSERLALKSKMKPRNKSLNPPP